MNHVAPRLAQTPPAADGWQARLDLGFVRRGEATLLARRRHEGPLRVQKPLYPEGAAVCHAIVLHPPAGVASGDRLDIRVEAASGHALLTSPGASRWYRSDGRGAQQRVAIEVGADAVCEWLPQETIVFDGALARMQTEVVLQPGARAAGWEILCLGRTAAGERFARGELRQHTRILRRLPDSAAAALLWQERLVLAGGSPLLDAAAGLQGRPVVGTLWAAGGDADAGTLAACRALPVREAVLAAVSALPGVLLARCLADSAQAARAWLAAVWGVLRPGLAGRDACTPRIWNT